VSISNSDKELVTNSLGVASFDIDPDTEQFAVTLRATDEKGRTGRRHVDLQSRWLAGDFIIRTDKAVYRADETVELRALGAGAEPVFVDLLKDGQTILTQTIDMTKRPGTVEIDLPPDLFGTLEFCAYRFDAAGLAVRKTRALYVHPSRQLEVKTALDRSEYRPGRT